MEALIKFLRNQFKDGFVNGKILNSKEISGPIVDAIKSKEIPEYPKEMSVSLKGIDVMAIKGDKGDKGDKGEDGYSPKKGKDYFDGKDGKTPTDTELKKLIRPLIPEPIKGDKGDSGFDGKDGSDGNDGKDGSPDKPADIVNKLQSLTGDERLDVSAIKGLDKIANDGKKLYGKAVKYLSNLLDVSIASPTNNQVLKYNSTTGKWENGTVSGGGTGTVDTIVAGNNIDVDATDPANPIVSVETLTLADISDVTASVTEVNYIDGVTSAIQTQLDAKQPLDSDLTTIAGLTATTDNFIQSKAGAWASRTIAQVKSDLGLTGTNSGDVTVSDTSEIDLTLTGQQISAAIVAGSIDESKLDASVNASLDLADSAAQLAFRTISVSGQSDVVADTNSDTLTLVAGTNITITTNAGTDTITIAASGGGSTPLITMMGVGI